METSQANNDVAFHDFRGCRLAYRVRGEGPPVIFIQGVGVHGDGWLPQLDGLSSRFRCVSFDNRGMGKSLPYSGTLSVESMAEDALALLDGLGWNSAHVVGHSLGGVIAQQIALTARARVRSLALLCTVARGANATGMSGRMLWLGIRSSVGSRPMRRRAFLEIVMPPGALAGEDTEALAARLKPLFGHDLADRPAVTMKQLGALRAFDSTARLHELAGVPTLVLSAEHDPIAPPVYGRALAAGIPGASYIEVPGASHGVTIQMADRINGILIDHVDRAERAGATT